MMNFFLACKSGNLTQVKEIYLKYCNDSTMTPSDELIGVKYACENGHLNIVEYFVERKSIDKQQINEFFIIACQTGQEHILNFLFSRFTPPWYILFEMMNKASISGNINILQLCISQKDLPENSFKAAVEWAASYGQLEVLKYLHNLGYSIEYAMRNATPEGHIQIVKWLVLQGCTIDEYDHYSAIRRGHFELIKYMFSQVNDYVLESKLMYYVSQHGTFETIEYFAHQGKLMSWNSIFSNARFSLDLPCIKLCHEYGVNINEDDVLIKCALKNNSISVIVFVSQFYSKEDFNNLVELYSPVELVSFYMIMNSFYYSPKWVMNDENVKTELWDGNLGMIVASYCW